MRYKLAVVAKFDFLMAWSRVGAMQYEFLLSMHKSNQSQHLTKGSNKMIKVFARDF
jgi:hypothetical protein